MKLYRGAVMAGVSLLSVSTSVLAQEATAARQGVSDAEIIVEARRRDERLQDVPLVVNAVTAESIEKLNLRSFQEITSVVPGLSLTPNANGIGSSSSMRGVNHDVNVSGENGTIQYYMNDAPVASNQVLQAMFDIGQIEVLRGPQGTLRGKATPSGSITVALRKPDLSAVGGNLQGTFGSADLKNIQGALNIPIIEDKLGVRIAGLYDFNRGNRVTSINSSVRPQRETEAIRVSVGAQPFDALKLGFVYQGMTSDAVFFDQMQSFGLLDPTAVPSASAPDYGTINPKDRRSVSIHPRRVDQKFAFYGWDAKLDAFDQSLIYVGSHQVSKFHPSVPVDTTNFFPALNPVQETFTNSPIDTHEVRLQNQERIAGLFDYVVGYFHQKAAPETRLNQGGILQLRFGPFPTGPASVNITPIFIPAGKTTEESIFGNITFHLGENTEIAGGLRRINYKDDSTGLYINCTPQAFASGTCVQTPNTENDFHEKKTIYNATIRHRFNDDLMVYAATGSSWRPPVNVIGDFSTSLSPNEITHTQLDAETSESYEIGFKSNWLDNKLLFNLTAYHQKFKNYPFRAGGAGIYFININGQGVAERSQFNFVTAVPVKVHGVEAELAWNPLSNFNISALLNYSKSKIGNALLACTDALNNATGAIGSDGVPDVTAPSLAQMQVAYAGEHLAQCPGSGGSATFLPEWSGSVQAEYSHPFSNSLDGYMRGLLTWRGSSDLDPTNPYDDVGAYGLFNLFAGIRDPEGAWDVSLFGKNLFNVTKITQRDSSALSTAQTNVLLGVVSPGPPPAIGPVGTSSSTFTSRYAGLAVTPEREFGISARFFFGSR